MRRTVFWLAFWLVLQGLAVSFGLYKGWEHDQQIRENTRDVAQALVIADAQRCVTAWVGREDTRDMTEAAYRRNAETLIGLSSNAPPARIEAYQEAVERDVVEIRGNLPDPECDLDAARALLDE